MQSNTKHNYKNNFNCIMELPFSRSLIFWILFCTANFCLCVCVCVCVPVCVHMCLKMHAHVSVHVYARSYGCMTVCLSTCVCAYVWVCNRHNPFYEAPCQGDIGHIKSHKWFLDVSEELTKRLLSKYEFIIASRKSAKMSHFHSDMSITLSAYNHQFTHKTSLLIMLAVGSVDRG